LKGREAEEWGGIRLWSSPRERERERDFDDGAGNRVGGAATEIGEKGKNERGGDLSPAGKKKGEKKGKWGTWERERRRERGRKERKEKKREKILTLGSILIFCDRTHVVLYVSIRISIFYLIIYLF
jgi:hypothetical protein